MKTLLAIILIISGMVESSVENSLEAISDDEFLTLVQNEKHVVALFSKSKDCKVCDKLESDLVQAREDLVDAFEATVVKLVSSPLAKNYIPSLEPAIIFFRNGIPMLYHEVTKEEDIVSTFQKCKDPTVKALNDDTFEHLTQAASGATTGDWLVLFKNQDCLRSLRLQAVMEAVACDLKHKLNVARVDKNLDGAVTSRRFKASRCPELILFRHGKMYRYNLDIVSVQNVIDFATHFYRNSKEEIVSPPKSPFDDFTEMIAEYLKDNPKVLQFGSVIGAGILLLMAFLRFSGKKTEDKSTKEKSKKSS